MRMVDAGIKDAYMRCVLVGGKRDSLEEIFDPICLFRWRHVTEEELCVRLDESDFGDKVEQGDAPFDCSASRMRCNDHATGKSNEALFDIDEELRGLISKLRYNVGE